MSYADLLLLGIPLALYAEYGLHSPMVAFIASAVAVLRLASWMGHATEQVAIHAGPRLGGFLNGTFGNMAELTIIVMSLRHGHHDLVKASLTGAIISNALLVLGAAMLAGGVRFKHLTFNQPLARLNSSLMLLATAGLVVPAVFHHSVPAIPDARLPLMSLIGAAVLLTIYVMSLFFSFKTHAHLFHTAGGHGHKAEWSMGKAIGVLGLATVAVVVMSEVLVSSVEPVLRATGLSELVLGVVIIAIIGNAAEHATAVTLAMKSADVTTSVEIAIGSTTQIALLVGPLAVVISWLMGTPMSLEFIPAELVAILLSVLMVSHVSGDGESDWLEGLMLVGLYVLIATGFFFIQT